MTPSQHRSISKPEFVALSALMFATIAFSIDSLMPVLPAISAELSLSDPALAASVLMAFMVGMGLGTLFTGPLSDAWGRKPIVYIGLLVYALGAILSYLSPSLEWLLAARVLQGLGASGPRVVSLAIIRDLYAGRQMASVMSLVMMVFLLIPGVAPLIGALIADSFGWRAIFGAYLVFGLTIFLWFGLRMHETLAPADRRPLRWHLMGHALVEMAQHPTVRLAIIVQTLMTTILLSLLTMVQPIFEVSFDRAATMPLWFGAIAVVSGVSSLLNARLVLNIGMRRLVTGALVAQICMSGAFFAFLLSGAPGAFAFFILWMFGIMFQGGLTIANLNAIAMEPMGHIAGMAASIMAAMATVISALAATGLAHLFDGTPLPLVETVLILCITALVLMLRMGRAEAVLAKAKDSPPTPFSSVR